MSLMVSWLLYIPGRKWKSMSVTSYALAYELQTLDYESRRLLGYIGNRLWNAEQQKLIISRDVISK
jgi:hypothetical protein